MLRVVIRAADDRSSIGDFRFAITPHVYEAGSRTRLIVLSLKLRSRCITVRMLSHDGKNFGEKMKWESINQNYLPNFSMVSFPIVIFDRKRKFNRILNYLLFKNLENVFIIFYYNKKYT